MMRAEDIEKKFSLVSGRSEYIRVSEDHPLELYLGLNENGAKTLRFNGMFSIVKVVGNKILEIKQFKTTNYNSILFSFNGEESLSIFYKFCEDIINQTYNYNGENGYQEIINRYNQWRKMFYGSKNILSEQEIQGLIGELMFLRDRAIVTYGTTEGLNSWSGPEPTHKDFSHDNEWFEIKAITNTKSYVTISSIEQLESNLPGKMIIYYLEKMSPEFNGVTLNKLVNEIMAKLENSMDRDVFLDKLNQSGYVNSSIYDNFVYNVVRVEQYRVDENFPRIKSKNLPYGIIGVKYNIEIPCIMDFRETKNGNV